MIVKVSTPTAHHIFKYKESLSALLRDIDAQLASGKHFIKLSDTLAVAIERIESVEDISRKETDSDSR